MNRSRSFRWLAGPALLTAATSCVPAPPHQVASRPERAIAAAAPLLKALALKVAPDQGPAIAPAALAAGAPPFLAATRSADDAARAIQCLTAAVYYEARSESSDGQRAVAQVVLNRVRDRAYPASVCGVVYQGSNRSTGCQFSFTCDGSLNAPREPAAWERARIVAQAALAGSVYAPIGGATSYHASSIVPWWASSLTRIGRIGAHIFYRWHDALEGALGFRQRYAGIEPGIGGFATSAGTLVADGGVRIHYAGAGEGDADAMASAAGVTIHRGETAEVPAAAMRAASTTVSFGVRVHSGGPPEAATAYVEAPEVAPEAT